MQKTESSALDRMMALIDDAHAIAPVESAPRELSDPVAQLDRWIDVSEAGRVIRASREALPAAWREILEQAEGWSSPLDIPVRPSSVEPLVFLRALIKGEILEASVEDVSVAIEPSPQATAVAPHPLVSETRVEPQVPSSTGRAQDEVLASLGRRDLPGAVRAEVIAMVADAIESPSPEVLRAILDRLVHG